MTRMSTRMGGGEGLSRGLWQRGGTEYRGQTSAPRAHSSLA